VSTLNAVVPKGGSLLDRAGTRIIYGGSDFVTARERSEKVITLKALPQVVFSRTGYICVPFGGKSATSVTASRFYTETNSIAMVFAFRLLQNY
jgi:hypothetical protein